MRDGIGVADHQISSPNPYYAKHSTFSPPHRSRLGLMEPLGRMTPYWRPREDAGSSIEVDLLVLHRLTNLTTEGCVVHPDNSWVNSANLFVSDDGINWKSLGVRTTFINVLRERVHVISNPNRVHVSPSSIYR